jgi:alkanesulfonate monooxygenase SsuD/methylene tetrahydromethanopterin reductase-like flavin-dependent oxidoreductase (luciferase family)
MAAATDWIRIGTTVTALPRRRPWELAAQAVAVDHLSAGRLILGCGAGDVADPGFTAVGEATSVRERAERLDEGLAVIDALWSGEAVSHHGRHYRIDGLLLAATPAQRPRIPVWVGGDLLVPGVRRRLTRWDGACVYKGPPGAGGTLAPDDVRDVVALVEATRGSSVGFDIKVSYTADRRALVDFAAAGATWCNRWIPPGPLAKTRKVIAAGPPD